LARQQHVTNRKDRTMTDIPRYGAQHHDGDFTASGSGDTRFAAGDSIADLLQGVIGNVQGIIRSEVRLAKAEVREEATSAGKAAGMLAVGAVLGAYAVGLLLLTIVYALNGPLPDWLAALIVFAVVAIAAAVLAKIGLDRIKQVSPKPEQTIDSIKEDVQWVKQQTR
jgi:uncharacterized membrane protein YqjE